MRAERSKLIGIILMFLALMASCGAQDVSVSNKVTNPSDHIIWVNDSVNSPKEATVQLNVTDLVRKDREAVSIVLAIDCSGSMANSDPMKDRVKGAMRFIDLMAVDRKNDQFGIVLWDDTVLERLEITDNIDAAKSSINNVSASGGTCIWEALNASDSLLQRAPTDKKIVVLFSDGQNECENPQSFKAKANEMRSNGIEIYTIGLGRSNIADLQAIGQYFHVSNPGGIDAIFDEVVARLKTSLENVKAIYQLPNGIEAYSLPGSASITLSGGINSIKWDIGPMYYQQTKTLSFKVNSSKQGTYLLAMPSDSIVRYDVLNGGTGQETIPPAELEVEMEANLFYDARAKGGNVFDEFHPGYKITASKDIQWGNFGCQDIFINITTPGIPCNRTVVFATDASGSTLQGPYGDSMMTGIENALNRHPSVQYARVDWDVRNNTNYASPNFQMASNWHNENISHPLVLSETDGTSYAAGLTPALQKIVTKKSRDTQFDRKITDYMVIFLTGKSEFDPTGVRASIRTATSNDIPVHAIGLEITGSGTTRQEAAVLANDISAPTGGVFYSISNNRRADVEAAVNEILSKSCKDREGVPAARNLTVVETVYPYFRVLGTEPAARSIKQNPDGTTTVVFDLGNLPGADRRSLVIHTAIDFFKLPVDVNNKKSRVDFSPASATPTSAIIYASMVDGKSRRIELPEGELSIFCGEPCIQDKAPEVAHAIEEAKNNTTENASQEAGTPEPGPGFGALFAAIGISLAGYAYRRRMH